MKERISNICSLLSKAEVFADVGCDHGYMAEYMLRNGLCGKAYITDISAKSLKKAETLLARYIADGRCIPIVSDGLDGIPEKCDFVLIAGMGGEEIVKILSRAYIPSRFLFQPMKNSEKLRRYLVEKRAKIERDYTFSEGTSSRKYYDLIAGSADGGDTYSEREFRFGRDNLKGCSYPFLLQMQEELEKTEERLSFADSEEGRTSLLNRKQELKETIHEVQANLRDRK